MAPEPQSESLHGIGQHHKHAEADEKSVDGRTLGPGVALITPGDALATLKLALHRLQLTQILRPRELRTIRFEPPQELPAARQRIKRGVRRSIIARVEAGHGSARASRVRDRDRGLAAIAPG